MKKYMIIAVVAALFAGCSSEDEEKECGVAADPRAEIKLSASVFDVQIRAPVNAGDSIVAQFVASATTGGYATSSWTATGGFKVAAGASKTFSFSPVQYYPVDGTVSVFIKGYYPAGTLSNGIVSFTGTDGTKDVMISNEASGNKLSSPLAFTFNHLLTQLQFNFVAGSGYDASKTVSSLTIRSQETPATLNIINSTLTYNAAGNITLTGPYAISTVGTVAANYPMVKSGSSSIVVDITTSDNVTYSGININNLTTEAGKAHKITLTFTPKEITATAIVTPWVTGGPGSSTVQ